MVKKKLNGGPDLLAKAMRQVVEECVEAGMTVTNKIFKEEMVDLKKNIGDRFKEVNGKLTKQEEKLDAVGKKVTRQEKKLDAVGENVTGLEKKVDTFARKTL